MSFLENNRLRELLYQRLDVQNVRTTQMQHMLAGYTYLSNGMN